MADVETGRDPSTLEQLVVGYRLSRCIYAITVLGIPDLLAAGPRTAVELAGPAGLKADRLHRVMRYLAAERIFIEYEDGRFSLTPISLRLTRNAPGSARAKILGWHGLPVAYDAFGHVVHSLRTSENAFAYAHGTHFHDFLAAHPDEASAYNAANEATVEEFDAAAAAYDFSDVEQVIDVGGGEGGFLVAILRRHPHLRGLLFELPHVAAGAPARLAGYPESHRIEVAAGDMFEFVPAGGGAYVFSTVLRCFEDDDCVRILRNCREAIQPGARVLALEMVVAPGPAPPQAQSDVVALILYGGRDRTEVEWSRLFHAAGMQVTAVIPADEPYYWIEAR